MLQLALLATLIVFLIRPGGVPDPFDVGDQLAWSVLCVSSAAPILIVAFSARQRLRTALDPFLGIYVLLTLAASVTSVDRPQSLLAVIALFANVAVFYATVATVRQREWTTPIVLMILLVGIAILELIALEFHLEQGLLARPAVYPRPEGWSGYPELGLLAAIQFAILVAIVQTRHSLTTVISTLVLLVVNVCQLALLYSRFAWIAVGGVAAAAGAVAVRARHVWRLALAAAVVLAVAAVLIWQNPLLRALAANMTGLESVTVAARASERVEIWRRTATMIQDHPWTGVGPGNFALVYEPNYNPRLNPDQRRGGHAHNLWLHQTAELGLPGGVSYLALWIAALLIAWKGAASSADRRAVFYVLVAVAVRNLGDNMFFSLAGGSARLSTLAWIFFAVASARGKAMKE